MKRMDWRKALVLVAGGLVGAANAQTAPLVAVKREPVESGVPAPRSALPSSAPFEFMGITLGAPLVPECPKQSMPHAGGVYELGTAKSACWVAPGMRPGARTDLRNNEDLMIVPLANSRPTGTGAVGAMVVNGVVEGLTVSTDGFAHAQELFAQLQQKLGAPTKQDVVHVSSGTGASFSSPRAVWELPGAYVQFNGIVETMNSDVIKVFSDAGRARDLARQKQRAKSF